nr:protein lin-52 homolog isoform X1 [Procambarus clarkii]
MGGLTTTNFAAFLIYQVRSGVLWLPGPPSTTTTTLVTLKPGPGAKGLLLHTPLDMEPSLLSLEKLDRSSPDLWPEQIPGVYDFAPMMSPQLSPDPQNLDLEEQDYTLLYQFRLLTALEIIEEVKKLQNVAYQLGLEEAKEMTRGKYLHILNNRKDK